MSKFFINRPIVAMVIAILMVIVGFVAMLSLPIAQFPKIDPIIGYRDAQRISIVGVIIVSEQNPAAIKANRVDC